MLPKGDELKSGKIQGNNPGGHSGEEIPVPIPNTEVKLSNADDTAFVVGK